MRLSHIGILTVCLVLAIGSGPAFAHEYDRDDSDYWLRYLAYAVHPVGVALEYTITRPIHNLVMKPKVGWIAGHDNYIPPEPEPEPLVEEPADDEAALRELLGDTIEVTETDGGIEYAIVGVVLFKPGLADLTDPGREALDTLATVLKDQYPGQRMGIEGHTDTQDIVHSSWRSNWELGAARALTLLHYLADNHGFDPELLSATTFGKYQGEATNDSDENMTRNRRAVIVVAPAE